MNSGSSDLVRTVAIDRYVQPAISSGRKRFTIAVRNVMKDLQTFGFPEKNYHQICTSLRTRKFLEENSLEIEAMDGPPKGSGPTVVYHYRVSSGSLPNGEKMSNSIDGQLPLADPARKAQLLIEKLRGLLHTELKEYGGGEAFLHWVRSEDEGVESATQANK